MVWKCPPLHLPNWNNLWKWKEQMNANELADELDGFLKEQEQQPWGTKQVYLDQAATMLRQQQDEIAELKVMLGHYEDVYEGVVTHPAGFARAILRKAQEK